MSRSDLGGNSTGSSIAASGDSVYVVWTETRMGFNGVYFNRSLDGGLTWLRRETRLESGVSVSDPPRVACAGQSVFVTFPCLAASWNLCLDRSADGGDTWLSSEVLLAPQATRNIRMHELLVEGPAVYAVWQQLTRSSADISFNRSVNSGLTWLATEIRLDDG